MCEYFCEFIDLMLLVKTLTDFTYLFPPNTFIKIDGIILKFFMTV